MTAVCPLCGAKPRSTMVDHNMRRVSRCPNRECPVVRWWPLGSDGLDVAEMQPAPARWICVGTDIRRCGERADAGTPGWVADGAGEHRCPDCASAVTP